MKKLISILCLGALLVTGCASHYVITMTNGVRVTTKGKPKLQEGKYVFKDLEGKPGYVPAGRVREIAPASMSKDANAGFRTGPGQ